MRKCLSYLATVVLALVVLFVVLWLRGVPLSETATQRTHRLCRSCGLAANEIGFLIEVHRNTTLTRQESVKEFFAGTYTDPARLEVSTESCLPCIEAILDMAGVE